MLEEQMQELRELPARVAGVELQIVQLRAEMRESFSAIRSDLGGKVEGLRVEMHGIWNELRTEVHGIRDELRTEIHGIRDKLLVEIRSGDRETQNFMKVLFQHHQSNLKTIGEQTPKRKR